MQFSYSEKAAGRRLLHLLLPIARERYAKTKAARGYTKYEAVSSIAKAAAPWVRTDNLDGVMIYQGALGGWIADITLKHTPIGVSNMMGTPVQTPHRTRQEAQDSAIELLMLVLTNDDQLKDSKDPPPPPGFSFHEFGVDLKAELLKAASEIFPDQEGYGTEAEALARLKDMEETLFPNGVSADALNALDMHDYARFMTAVHLAAMTGVFRYPPHEPGTPSGHTEHRTKQ